MVKLKMKLFGDLPVNTTYLVIIITVLFYNVNSLFNTFSKAPKMEVKMAILILVLLMVGGEALKCNVCKEVKTDGKVDETRQGDSALCSNANSTRVCLTNEDTCLTTSTKFKFDLLGLSTEQEQTFYGCGSLSAADSTVCDEFEGIVDDADGFADFSCSIIKCQANLCNAGKTVQVSFFMFTALIAIFGLFF